MNKKVKWGVLGCANIAYERFLPGMLSAYNAELYALASRGGEKLEKFIEAFHPEAVYNTYDELLNDPLVEAVYIPLPNALHYEWVLKAADCGKHILCEKPMALNTEDAKRMFDRCKEKKVLLMEAFAYRHSPLVQKVKALVQSGEIGTVKYVESHLTDVLTDRNNIRFSMDQKNGGGSFYDMACYNINLISYICEKDPVKVKALQEMDPEGRIDVSNTVIMYYGDGTQAMSYSSLNSYAYGGYTIVGEKGRIEVPCNYNCRGVCKFYLIKNGRVSNVEIVDEERCEYAVQCPQNYMLEAEQMSRCILEGEEPLITEEETVRNHKILDMVFESLQN